MYTSFLYSVTKRSSRMVIFTMRTHTDITTQTEDSHPSGSQDITTCRWNPLHHLTENRVHFASGIVTQVQHDLMHMKNLKSSIWDIFFLFQNWPWQGDVRLPLPEESNHRSYHVPGAQATQNVSSQKFD